MATIDLGKIAITPEGQWSYGRYYEKLSLVIYNGQSYLSLRNTTGDNPETSRSDWMQITSRGESLYQMMVREGKFVGTEEEFLQQYLDSLKACADASEEVRSALSDILDEMDRVRAEISEVMVEEDIRIKNEAKREAAEINRRNAEITRGVEERNRQEAEQRREQSMQQIQNDAEIALAMAAEAQQKAEEAILNEEERVKAENQRKIDEATRIQSEEQRVNDEAMRRSREADRQESENIRQKNEGDRILAEREREEIMRNLVEELKALAANRFKIVDVLPEVGEFAVIYLVPSTTPSDNDVYDEWAYVSEKWEHIGSTRFEMDNYFTKEEVEAALDTKANIQHQHTVADITDFPELYYDATAFFTSGAYPSDKYEELFEAVKAKRTVYATIDEAGYVSYIFFVSSANSDGSSSRVLLTTIFADGGYLYINTFVLQQSGMTALRENITSKANKATTLAGYGIGDAYTKREVDTALNTKQNTISDLETIRSNAQKGNVASSDIASIVKAGYVFAGVATPTTNPSTPNAKVFYIANGKGTYTNFGSLEVTEDEVVILYYDTAWHKVSTGIASDEKLSELEQEVIGPQVIDVTGTGTFQVGRVFTSGIDKSSYPNYRYMLFDAKKGDIIHYKTAVDSNTIAFGLQNSDGKTFTKIQNGVGTSNYVEGDYPVSEDSCYVICGFNNAQILATITRDGRILLLENKMGDLLDGIHTNLLEGAEWEVGRIFHGHEINTTDYPDYRVFKFQCNAGDKLKVVASYTPTPAFLGYIKEDNRVEVVVNGTGGAIEETTIDCVDATYVICQYVDAIKNITKLEKFRNSIIQSIEGRVSDVENNLEQKIDDAPVNGKQYVRKNAGWEEVEVKSKEPVVTDLRNSVEWKNGRVVNQWIDTSASYSKLCEIEIANDGDELIVASNKSGPANVPFLSKKTDATHATNIISSTDGGAIPEQRIVCEKGVYIVCIYSHPTTDVTVLTKIEYPVDEQKEENKRNRGFLYGKTIASLGDSLSTSGLWQNELVKKGVIFDAEKNYTAGQLNYSEGGTVTCDAKDANCGHIRARRLVEDGVVIPDVIFIENVNDSRLAPPPNHETPSDIDDEPFFLSDVINYATTYNSKQDAIDAWENNFMSIVGSVTAKKGVAFLLKYNVSAKVFTINSAPTQNGYIEITATGNDAKRITLTTGDTIGSVIEKILAYDYVGWSDSKKSTNGVLFSPSITGDVDITANTCGLTFTKTTEESTNSIARYFCSVDVSKWNDKAVWKENPGLFASYKGIVEYLQTAFPTAQIVFFIPETWGLNYNASTYKRADGTIDVDKIAKSYSYVGYLFTLQKQFCERYNLRVIDVRGKCGANYINISQFNAPDEVHPKNLGYQRWGEEVVRELN